MAVYLAVYLLSCFDSVNRGRRDYGYAQIDDFIEMDLAPIYLNQQLLEYH